MKKMRAARMLMKIRYKVLARNTKRFKSKLKTKINM